MQLILYFQTRVETNQTELIVMSTKLEENNLLVEKIKKTANASLLEQNTKSVITVRDKKMQILPTDITHCTFLVSAFPTMPSSTLSPSG